MFCGLVVVVVVVGCEPGVVVGCEAGVVVAAMVVGLSVESSSGSGGTNRPPRVLPTNTDLEGGGSGGGRGAVTTRVLTVVVLILIPVFLFCAVLVMVIFCSYKFWKLFVSAFTSRICVSRKIVLLP